MSSKANQRRQLRRLTEEGRPPIRGELLLSHQYHHHEEEDEDFPPLHSPAAAEETFVSGPAGGDHQEAEGCMSSYTVTPKRGAYPSDWDDELDDHLAQEDHTPLNYDFDDDDDVLVPYVFGRSRSASAIRHQRPQPPSELNADAAPFVPNPGVTANVVGYLDGSTTSHQPIQVTRSAQPSPQASNNNALLQYNPNATTALYGSVSSPSYQRRAAGGGHHSTTSGGTQLFSFHHSSSSERAAAPPMNVAPLGSSTSSSSAASAAGSKWSSHSLVKLKQSWLNALLADIANPLTINSVVDFLVRPPLPPPEQQKLRNCRGSATSPLLGGFRHPLSYFLIPMPRLRYIHPSINELAIRKLRFNSQVVIKTKMAAREPTDTEERFILSPQGLPGLENAISADWMICILFCVYYLLPPLRQIVARHSCDVSTCWICELAFLYRMMDLAKGENRGIPCRADNFLSALFRVSQVKSLGLREDEMTFDDEVTYIHPSVGGVSPPQATDISTAVVVGTGPGSYSDDHNDSSCLSCPVDDGSSTMLHHHARHYTTAHHPHHWSPFITPQVYPVWGDSPPPGNDGQLHHQNPPPQILPPYPSSGSSGGAPSEQSSFPPPPRLYFPTAGDLNRQHVLNTMRQLESEKQKILQSHEKRSQMHERFHRILFFLVHSLTKLSLTPDDTMSFTVNVLRRCACDCRSPILKGTANGNIIRLPILDLNYDPWILRNHAAGSDHITSSSFADVLAGSLWNQKDSSAQPPYQCPTCRKRTFPQTMETQVLSPLPDILTIKCKLSSDSSTGVSLNSPASVGLSNQIVEFWRRGGCAMDFRDFDPPIGLADSKVFKMVGSMSGNEPLSVALRTEERLCNLFKRIVNDTVPTSTRASLVNSLRISRCNTILAPRITVRSRSDNDEGSAPRLTLPECTACGRAVSQPSAGAQDTSKDSNPWVVSEHTSSCPIGEGDEDMYELVGVVSSVGYVWSDIKSSFFRSLSECAVNLEEEWVNQPPTEGHMVAHLKIPQLDGETNSDDDGIIWQWYSLNASVVTKATEHEALDFMPLWRYPCMLIYAKVSSVWNAEAFKIPEPPPLLHQCLYGSTNISQNTQMSNQIRTFTPLFADEISNIKQGNFMVGLDAEHVVSQLFKKPGVRIPHPILSLGRISMLRAGGSLEGVPFIDHYVLSKKEPVDYRTAYSGLKQGDLNLNSPYFLTTHKYVYQVLRCLIHYGCCFVGHDLFNDFRVINIFVPTSLIVDTVELFRLSSSSRLLSLKFLAFHVLNMRVQQNIHDSIEDSRCALALYKEYIKYLVSNDEEGFKNVVSNLYVTGYRDNFKLFDE